VFSTTLSAPATETAMTETETLIDAEKAVAEELDV